MTSVKPGEHWTNVYRTDPYRLYETEKPIFENPELTERELELAAEVAAELGVELASPILDMACGPGRHSRALRARGQNVVGFDHSLGLLGIGRLRWRGSRPVCADMRRQPFRPGSFRTAILLGKSFGYFSDAVNRGVLEQARDSLEPGGFLCLEAPDREPYLATLRPRESEEVAREDGVRTRSEWLSRWNGLERRLEIRESHTLAATGETLWAGDWDVRLYDGGELVEQLRAAGFREAVARPTMLPEAAGAKSEVLIVGAVR